MKRPVSDYPPGLVKPFSEEEQAKRRRPLLDREGFRRVAVLIAPTGLYAVLVLISLLGGPRIGAPLIPLPGGGGAEATSPEAGQQPGQLPSRTFPSIPWQTQTPVPPTSATVTPLPSTVDPSTGQPVDRPTTPTTEPTIPGKPTPTTAERSLPPLPPVTKLPPRPTSDPTTAPTTAPTSEPTSDPTTDPPVPPSTRPTTPDNPDQPEPPPPTVVDTLLGLLDRLL